MLILEVKKVTPEPRRGVPRKVSNMVASNVWLPAVSALLGASIGAGGALLADRQSLRHDRGTRWDRLRLEAYSELLTAATKARTLLERFLATIRVLPYDENSPESRGAARAALEALSRLKDAQRHAQLLGGEAVVDALAPLTDFYARLLPVGRGARVARPRRH